MLRTIVLQEELCDLCFKQEGVETLLEENEMIQKIIPVNGIYRKLTLCRDHAQRRWMIDEILELFEEYGEHDGSVPGKMGRPRKDSSNRSAHRQPKERTIPEEEEVACPMPSCGHRYYIGRKRYLFNHIIAHVRPGRFICHIDGCKNSLPGAGFDQEPALGVHLKSKHGIEPNERPTPTPRELATTLMEAREEALEIVIEHLGMNVRNSLVEKLGDLTSIQRDALNTLNSAQVRQLASTK